MENVFTLFHTETINPPGRHLAVSSLQYSSLHQKKSARKMHLWPSMRIRDSFKVSYLSKLEWNLQRMNTEKKKQQSQTNNDHQQKLLSDDQRDDLSGQVSEVSTSKNPSGCAAICRETLMLLSCCYCCFCCGGKIVG
ncbi:hypothetical protein ACOSQ4_033150 [Xanthoceras sorbifolium]